MCLNAVNIVTPKIEDIDQIAVFLNRNISYTYYLENIDNPIVINEKIISHLSLLRDYFAGKNSISFLIAKKDNDIIGTVAYGPARSKIRKYVPKAEVQNLLEIKCLYVCKNFHGQGVGNTLWNSIKMQMYKKGYRSACLASSFKEAQNMWSKKIGSPTIVIDNDITTNKKYMIWKFRF